MSAQGPLPVGVFHPGTQHSWQTALALQRLDRLAWYATSIFYRPDRWPYRLERLPAPLGPALAKRFHRFSHPELDPERVRTVGAIEWFERIASLGGARALARRLDALGNRRFARGLAAAIHAPDRFALWGYNGSSLETFALARDAGRATILDRTIGDWRAHDAAMARVASDYPQWFLPGEQRVDPRQIERDDAEYALADTIVCGGDFAAATVRDHAPAAAGKVRVLPYCFDERLFGGLAPPRPALRDEPVRFLFLGLVIPRKGIHHVLEAIERIAPSAATLTVVGQVGVPAEVFARYAGRIEYVPGVARDEVPAIMARHHALVLPSHFEGSALTLLEALAAGMAVIQTAQAGNGADDTSGIVLERPDTDALHAAMMTAIEDRDRLDAWRAAAQARARRFSFAAYCANIAALLDDLGL